MRARQRLGVVLIVAVCVVALQAQPQETPQPPGTVPTVEVADTLPSSPGPGEPMVVAVPVQDVPSPAAPSNAQEQVMWALAAAYLLQFLKGTRWFTFLSEESSSKAKAVSGLLMAIATTAGIQFAVTGSPLDSGGASVTITGLTITGLKDVLFQWAAQQGWYDAIVRKSHAATTELRA